MTRTSKMKFDICPVSVQSFMIEILSNLQTCSNRNDVVIYRLISMHY